MDLLTAFYIAMGINIVMFIPAYLFKTDKLTDISYAVTFAVLALSSLFWGEVTLAALLVVAMVLLWAIRLGGYLLIRIHKIGKDDRYDEMRQSFWRFGRFWVLQGLSVWLVMIPSVLFLDNPTSGLSWLSYLGLAVWALGLVIEAVADFQKYTFINNKENKDKWIETGLWRYSRHPNYFGEICVWLGVYLFTLNGLVGLEVTLGLVSPVYIALLLIFGSGVPILEEMADKKWGDNPQYQKYKKETSVLVPWFRG